MNQIMKRVLLMLASLLLLVYVGFQVYQVFDTTMNTIPAERAIAYETVETNGIVFRDETVLGQQPNGYLFYTAKNGSRVAKGGTIATIFPTQQDALMQQQLDALDSEINTLITINAQGTSNRANLSSINQQINDVWLSIAKASVLSAEGDLSAKSARLLALLNKKQLTIGKEENFDDRIASLQQQRTALASSYKKASGKVASPVAGYFVNSVDGYEDYLGQSTVTSLTVDQVRHALAYTPTDIPENRIGKIVGDFEWYLACVVSQEQSALLKKGSQVDIRLPFVLNATIPVEVVAVNKGNDNTVAVIFSCTHMSDSLSSIRNEKTEIRLQKYEGIRVPDESIYFNDKQEPGVYIRVGNILYFRKIQVIYHNANDKYSLSSLSEDKSYIQLYDQIVEKGENLYDGKIVR